MKRSTTKILTTHSGSIARPDDLRDLLIAMDIGETVDEATFDAACEQAVRDVVRKQNDIGIAVVNDGDQSKISFSTYVNQRLDGFEFDKQPARRVPNLEMRDFPEYYAARTPPTGSVLSRGLATCTGPIAWRDFSAVEKDVRHMQAAVADFDADDVFMTAVSPGSFVNFHPNRYYAKREDYLAAVAEIMKREYEAIAAAGFIVQLDSPDLAQRSNNFPDLSVKEFRRVIEGNIEALNHATREISPEQLRIHVCWGAGEAPHKYDTELKDIVDVILKARPAAFSIVSANGRHEHEWKVWEDVQLPDGKVVITGVIDNTTNIIEHPETVAQRIIRYAKVVGRENVIAGVDCGFGTVVTKNPPPVDPKIAWTKLQALVEGAELASKELFPGRAKGRD